LRLTVPCFNLNNNQLDALLIFIVKGKEPTGCDKVSSFYCLNMFRAPICPSSGVQLIPSAFRWSYLEERCKTVSPSVMVQCGGLASREFVSDVTARGRGSLVVFVCVCVCVCVCRGCLVCRVDTGWVGLDRMWGCLCGMAT
jgi:hypothetical protein